MMRWIIFSVVVVVFAGIATVASTYFASSSPIELVPTAQEKPSGPPGEVTVDGELLHQFGVMSQQSDGKFEWTVTNKGIGDIILEKGESTCSCTIANFGDGHLSPGKTTKVTLNWNTKGNDGKYSQRATVLVKNDPTKQKLDFQVSGTVVPPLLTMPREPMVQFLEIANDQPHSREMVIFSIDRPEVKLTGATSSNPALVDVAIILLPEKEIKILQEHIGQVQKVDIKKAAKVVVTVKPGAPLGAFEEEVIVTTDHPQKPRYSLQVGGKVTGPITVTPERVRLLDVASKQGDSQTLTVWVRDRKTTKFTVEKKPKDFDVQITAVAGQAETNARKYQLTVKVPPGTPPGTVADEIILKTDHPQASEVKIPVAVFIRAS